MSAEAVERTRKWLNGVVIDLDLCPFAAGPERRGGIRITASSAHDFDDAARAFLEEIETLMNDPEVETTLLVFPHALARFEELLDLAATAEYLLEEADLLSVFQVVGFHPDYVFEAADEDDLANYTNRTPYPTLHLIREADMSQAIDSHPDPEGIPERNIELLRGMTLDEIRKRWTDA